MPNYIYFLNSSNEVGQEERNGPTKAPLRDKSFGPR